MTTYTVEVHRAYGWLWLADAMAADGGLQQQLIAACSSSSRL